MKNSLLTSLNFYKNAICRFSTVRVVLGCTIGIGSLAIAGCGRQTSSAPRVAIVLMGSAEDNAWNETASTAGKALSDASASGVEVAVSEKVSPAMAEGVMAQYAKGNYDLIVAHAPSYQEAAIAVAAEYPNIHIALAGAGEAKGDRSETTLPENLAEYDPLFYKAAYSVGAIATKLSRTGKLGAMYGIDTPNCRAMGTAMLMGARSVRPGVSLTEVVVGDWGEIESAKDAAIALSETGIDYWLGCGTGATLGTIKAARQTDSFATGYATDMSQAKTVVASIAWDMEPMLQAMLEDIKAGEWSDRYTSTKDAVEVVINPEFEDEIGKEMLEELKKTQRDIASGKLDIPYEPNPGL